MFSGIVEGTGLIQKIALFRKRARLSIRPPFSVATTKLGDSIAVNGCCLTVVAKNKTTFDADLSHETLAVTNLGRLKKGDLVNLERPLRLQDRIGGHLVQGHVDGVGKILKIQMSGNSVKFEIGFPQRLRRYLIPKGSVAVDGISMTVNRLTPRGLTLYAIPHTLQRTNLKSRSVGELVNLEVDLIGKYVENLKKY